jgi:xanthine dehydrogenase small subunit
MAGTPKRAKHAEAALGGAEPGKPESWERAVAALERDYTPMSDMRASADYRLKVVQNLLRKTLSEISGEAGATRVSGVREAAE